MNEKKGPKGFKRWILDNDGKELLMEALELMKEAVKKFDSACTDHLVIDWVIHKD